MKYKNEQITPKQLSGQYAVILLTGFGKRLLFELSIKEGISNTSYVVRSNGFEPQFFMDLHAAVEAYNAA